MTRTLGIVRGESGALAVADTCHVPSLSPERVNEAHDDIPRLPKSAPNAARASPEIARHPSPPAPDRAPLILRGGAPKTRQPLAALAAAAKTSQLVDPPPHAKARRVSVEGAAALSSDRVIARGSEAERPAPPRPSRAASRTDNRKDHARGNEALISPPCSMLVLARGNRPWRPASQRPQANGYRTIGGRRLPAAA